MKTVAEAAGTSVSAPESRPQAARRAALPAKTGAEAPGGSFNFERPQRLEYDVDAQGAIWVRGTSYKASFGADGATYVPFLGSSAPRSFPVTFTLAGATSGCEQISLAPAAGAVRDADRVVIDRGPIDEVYELSLGAVEQTFTIEERPQGDDLSLWIGFSTDLSPSQTPDGFEFGNELGAVRYGKAFVREADGTRVEVEASLDGNSIRIDVPAEYLAGASFPLVIDPVVTTFSIDTTTLDNFAADVAFDATNTHYYVVYEEVFSASDYDAYTVIIDDAGAIQSSGYADFSSEDWRGTRCASLNAYDQFMVVASAGAVTGEANRCIRGRQTGAIVIAYGVPFTIAGGALNIGDKVNPDVGGDPYSLTPSYYCVVYQRNLSTTDTDIHCQLVRNDGTNQNPSTIYIDNSGASLDQVPSVSKGNAGVRWNVAWQRQVLATNRDIRAAQIHWDGTIDTVSTAVVSTTSDDTNPSAATPFDNGEWALVWERDYTTDHDILGVNMNGATPGSIYNLSILEAYDYLQDQVEPSVDSDGQHFALTYSESWNNSATDYDPLVSSFHVLGGAIYNSDTHWYLASSITHEGNPEMTSRYAAGGTPRRFCIVWDDLFAAGDHNIEGGIYDGLLGGPIARFCYGDGSGTACPCGNNGGIGRGCANSVNPAGTLLVATGFADISSDTLLLTASGLPTTTTCLFFQGTAVSGGGAGTLFGDGLRCAAGTVIRLGTKTASGGIASYPGGADPDVSVRGLIPAAGAQRYYQNWYRNTAPFCTPAGYNTSNGVSLTWLP